MLLTNKHLSLSLNSVYELDEIAFENTNFNILSDEINTDTVCPSLSMMSSRIFVNMSLDDLMRISGDHDLPKW